MAQCRILVYVQKALEPTSSATVWERYAHKTRKQQLRMLQKTAFLGDRQTAGLQWPSALSQKQQVKLGKCTLKYYILPCCQVITISSGVREILTLVYTLVIHKLCTPDISTELMRRSLLGGLRTERVRHVVLMVDCQLNLAVPYSF